MLVQVEQTDIIGFHRDINAAATTSNSKTQLLKSGINMFKFPNFQCIIIRSIAFLTFNSCLDLKLTSEDLRPHIIKLHGANSA